MTKALEKAIDALRALPEKDQDLVSNVVLSVVERTKGSTPIDLAELARRSRSTAAKNGMTAKVFDQMTTDA